MYALRYFCQPLLFHLPLQVLAKSAEDALKLGVQKPVPVTQLRGACSSMG
eukprot:CAMPEP_0113900848 /NCGR_PEP_ID=MMETSP0780_2-20120614/20917_1 /TAXON_ID=652834 /ORGANISM="Palpitomonas bilix" /LENGTH=49 /DNA_ID=CAMNT_0000893377 /DNA_START=493 /DNA_END=642 /DNA_ORIENTATION=+ /assembly_acc=CAM_ASM_000599